MLKKFFNCFSEEKKNHLIERIASEANKSPKKDYPVILCVRLVKKKGVSFKNK